ncbi:hypothetical protein LPB19_16135 [Marinobacter salinisoli]|uniref:Uncharacterized protein n=1 Tax=Marinobacter salinisoli TaxID=2769486 RepID=A0ABX7MQT7_9GAMM|nr:hypothetical protein [Marinobacter salinisoli]QSP94678.1 hypothetical protein LPB19_16135 [Marinobacter salinisoli]
MIDSPGLLTTAWLKILLSLEDKPDTGKLAAAFGDLAGRSRRNLCHESSL